jgi:hypothetical protein
MYRHLEFSAPGLFPGGPWPCHEVARVRWALLGICARRRRASTRKNIIQVWPGMAPARRAGGQERGIRRPDRKTASSLEFPAPLLGKKVGEIGATAFFPAPQTVKIIGRSSAVPFRLERSGMNLMGGVRGPPGRSAGVPATFRFLRNGLGVRFIREEPEALPGPIPTGSRWSLRHYGKGPPTP